MIMISDVRRATALFYRIGEADLMGPSKVRKFSKPRQLGMFLSRELTGKSYPLIAQRFNRSDHTTVVYACQAVAARLEKSQILRESADAIRRMVIDLNSSHSTFPQPNLCPLDNVNDLPPVSV